MSQGAKGIAAILLACTIWGFATLFYKAMSHVPPLEVLAHRSLWTLVLFGAVLSLPVVVAVMLLTSSLWFSRTDQMSDDGWFRGFPSAWNMVIPTLWILEGSQLSSSVVIILLSILTLTDIEFAHPVRARSWRAWNLLSMTVWIWSVVAGVSMSPDVPMVARMVVLVGPVMIAVTVVSRVLGSASDDPMGDALDDTFAPR